MDNHLYCVVAIESGWNGWDHDVEETIIKVYRTREEAERNKPENTRQYAGGDAYNSFYNYTTYEVRRYD